jgi:hypothetical protein
MAMLKMRQNGQEHSSCADLPTMHPSMTPAQFTSALDRLGWSKRHLASLLSCNTNLPSWWASGREPVRPDVARWLARLAAFHLINPPPKNWRRR